MTNLLGPNNTIVCINLRINTYTLMHWQNHSVSLIVVELYLECSYDLCSLGLLYCNASHYMQVQLHILIYIIMQILTE